MSNAASLYLPGSNLTNLLVLSHDPTTGTLFAARMIAPALAATFATAVGLLVIFRARAEAVVGPSSVKRPEARPVLGAIATLTAAALTIALSNPALAVLAVGVTAVAVQCARGRTEGSQVLGAVGPLVLVGLFTASVMLGVLARAWSAPGALLNRTGLLGSAAVGALAALLINNLPAAMLLSARAPIHPRALLLGLNLAPNLAVSGSLSAYLWFKAASRLGQRPSLLAFSRRGLILAPLALLAALAAMNLTG
jgi:arsenical pump membrane protein